MDFGLSRAVICERAREVLPKVIDLEAASRMQRYGSGGSASEADSECMCGEQISGTVDYLPIRNLGSC